jgi:hypothetical protein
MCITIVNSPSTINLSEEKRGKEDLWCEDRGMQQASLNKLIWVVKEGEGVKKFDPWRGREVREGEMGGVDHNGSQKRVVRDFLGGGGEFG